jgi:CheY-like chemotaxis protein
MHRVLVIDDQSAVRASLRLALTYLGYSVEEAENGKEGLRKARENTPDLILCDFDMPVMDGLETLMQVRKDPVLGRMPVIIMSAMVTEEEARRLMKEGANAVLLKPFALADLTSLIERCLIRGETGEV